MQIIMRGVIQAAFQKIQRQERCSWYQACTARAMLLENTMSIEYEATPKMIRCFGRLRRTNVSVRG
jgi:hypothetical protein